MNSVIEITNLTRKYGDSIGVEGLNFAVEAGSIFGFLGPNGAGKSTTINMLVDLLRPTSGDIKIFGLDSVKDSVEIRKKIGFLAGDMAMDRALSGWQQLEYLGNMHGNFDRAYVQELADRLECKLEKRFKTLSRGNKQKIGLIAALMHKPDLLILDEPTSGLDPLIQAEFNAIMLEYKKAGKTVFISSHVLSEVQEICDSVTFIREGHMIATKQMRELGDNLPKIFIVRGAPAGLAPALKKLKGITVSSASEGAIKGSFEGDVNELLKVVAKFKVRDFTMHDTDLEAVFMKYYEGEK